MGIFEDIVKYDPRRNCIANAIDLLREREQIKEFVNGYTNFLAGKYADPEALALGNIEYSLGYYGDDTRKRWKDAVPRLHEFALGRKIDMLYSRDG